MSLFTEREAAEAHTHVASQPPNEPLSEIIPSLISLVLRQYAKLGFCYAPAGYHRNLMEAMD